MFVDKFNLNYVPPVCHRAYANQFAMLYFHYARYILSQCTSSFVTKRRPLVYKEQMTRCGTNQTHL